MTSVSNVNASIPMVEKEDPYAEKFAKTLGRDQFMTLFITQLQNQDPMAPMESYEMASQLAQFSSLETTMNMDDHLKQLLAQQSSQNNLQLISLLDKKIQAAGNQVAVNDGTPTATEFGLEDDVESCVIEVYDAADRLVRTLEMGPMEAGTYDLAWDGKNSGGDTVEDGGYAYVVKGLTSTGEYSPIDYRTSGTVTGLQFDAGQASVTLDNFVKIAVSDIIRVLDETPPVSDSGATSTTTDNGTTTSDTGDTSSSYPSI